MHLATLEAFADEIDKIGSVREHVKSFIRTPGGGALVGGLGGAALGGGIGAGVGALTGEKGKRKRRALKGAGIGAGIGGLTGAAVGAARGLPKKKMLQYQMPTTSGTTSYSVGPKKKILERVVKSTAEEVKKTPRPRRFAAKARYAASRYTKAPVHRTGRVQPRGKAPAMFIRGGQNAYRSYARR
jgi:hypothetical protein